MKHPLLFALAFLLPLTSLAAKKDEIVVNTNPPTARLLIWDGEKHNPHGISWAVPKGSSLIPTKEEAHSGKTALAFSGDGSGYVGAGYNFFGYYPPDSGIDISNYDNLSFWIKVDAPPKKGPGSPTVSLNCSGSKLASGTVNIADYCKDYDDGKWHEVVIPLKHLYNKKFDPASMWEIIIGSWAGEDRRFTIYLDDIAVDTRPD